MAADCKEIQHNGGCVDKDLSGFDFEQIDGEDELEFEGCAIRDTRIKGEALIASTWRNCRFINCEFVGANLREAQFEGCVFFESATARPTVFQYCDLKRTKFGNCNMSLVKIVGCEAYDVVLENCQMRGVHIETTKIVQMAGKRRFSAGRFTACQLVDAIFDQLDLTSCQFDDCDLSFSSFQEARLVNVVMRDCNLESVETVGADFSGADLRGSELAGFSLAELKGYAGLMVSASQQHHLLGSLGVDVSADGC